MEPDIRQETRAGARRNGINDASYAGIDKMLNHRTVPVNDPTVDRHGPV